MSKVYKGILIKAYYVKKNKNWGFSCSNTDELWEGYCSPIEAISQGMRLIDNLTTGLFNLYS